jgi:azurin
MRFISAAAVGVLVMVRSASGESPVPEPRASDRGMEVWMAKPPLEPALWPEAGHAVNRDRIFDFYAKQADFFAAQPDVLDLILPEYPGLDSGRYGHWGNQNEEVWKDARWNQTDHGSVVSNVWRGAGMTIPKAVSVQLARGGDGRPGLAAVFNPVTATWDAVWSGGFVTFSDIRHGFMEGATMAGEVLTATRAGKPPVPVTYRGFYRHGEKAVFVYAVGGRELVDWAEAKDGVFVRQVMPREAPEAAALMRGGPSQWPQVVETREVPGVERPGDAFVIDTLTLPFDNPWKALMHLTGHDFFPDGTGAICTMGGEVWTVLRSDESPARLRWRRFASGLHQPLGLKIVDGKIHVLGRDQITRLHDLNADGEADFYECVTNAYETSPGGHDFITGLELGPEGSFYFVSATQGVCRVSPGDGLVETLATGFRNANGVAVAADGTVLTNGQEGEWTNASVVFQFRPGAAGTPKPYFGYGGPKPGQTIAKPLLQLPRGFDNSTGGACFVEGAAGPGWQALRGLAVNTSFGAGTASILLRDAAAGGAQGAAVAIPGSFRSGVHRARFAPHDGHLYVSGSAGWGTYTPDDGCLHRVRVVAPPQLPVAWEACDNGVRLTFSQPVDPVPAASAKSHFAQVWNYRFAADYGSPEYSVRHPGTPGHDPLEIRSAHVLDGGRGLFLEIPQLTPASQLHLRLRVGGPRPIDLFASVHSLAPAFTDFPGYQPVAKIPVPDAPLSLEAVSALSSRKNPWVEGASGRGIVMEAALGLQFATKRLAARPRERISLTFKNPDLVPHNFVLANPGALAALGDQVNKLISRPGAAARHYVPESPDVLVWTDMVNPGQEFTIHFDAPIAPGAYPYFCSFPGHWQVMNGVLEVKAE